MTASLESVINPWGAPTLEGFETNSVQPGERLRGARNRQFVRFYKRKFAVPVATSVRTNPNTGEVKVLKSEVREVEREMIQVITPGDKNTVDDIATDWHRREFWAHYKAFRDGKTAPLGTPIEEVDFVSSSVALELKYLGCHTLEQLADGSDLLANQIPSGFELREYARAVCKANASTKEMEQVTALKNQLAASQDKMFQMEEKLKKFEAMLLDSDAKPIDTSLLKKPKIKVADNVTE